jgi:hypothetical protein
MGGLTWLIEAANHNPSVYMPDCEIFLRRPPAAMIEGMTVLFPAGEALQAAVRDRGQKASGGPLALKSEPGPPMTLGNAAAAKVRLIVWWQVVSASGRARSRRDGATVRQHQRSMGVQFACSKCGSPSNNRACPVGVWQLKVHDEPRRISADGNLR